MSVSAALGMDHHGQYDMGPQGYPQGGQEMYGGYDQYAGAPPMQGYGVDGMDHDPYGQPPQGSLLPEQSGMPGAGMQDSYTRFTEEQKQGIDKETGIAPRRLTDCVCTFIFALYVLGMIIMVLVVKNHTVDGRQWSDVQRLTHGMDFKARLCGVDPGVEDKPFVFWCRYNVTEEARDPAGIDLWNPSCIEECPNGNYSKWLRGVECLYPQLDQLCTSDEMSVDRSTGKMVKNPCKIPTGQFGNVGMYHVQSQQSIVITKPYDTVTFGGKYCLPQKNTLRKQILHGPVNLAVRLHNSVGSFGRCWGVLFMATCLAIMLGYLYVLLMKTCEKFILYGFLTATLCMFTAGALFFLFSLVGVIPVEVSVKGPDGSDEDVRKPLDQTYYFSKYKAHNPFFGKNTLTDAVIVSCVLGVVLMKISCGICGTITHVAHRYAHVRELTKASFECFISMRSMLIPPALEAIWKFVLTWILAYNFQFLVAVGSYDDHRISIDGEHYKGVSAKYNFDYSITPWILYYLFGCVWIIELCNSFGHFVISFSVISWYFMKKEGREKTNVPPMPAMHAVCEGVKKHFGSLCLSAALIPWVRLVRIFMWVEDESVPDKNAECCKPCHFLTNPCQAIGKMCDGVRKTRKSMCQPACMEKKGCVDKFSKMAFADIIIRSQHFFPAAERASLIILNHKACERYMGKCRIITVVGVVSIGIICASVTYMTIVSLPSLSDPAQPGYIADPVMVAVVALFMCGSIAYGFCMLIDHVADTILYCYAWNKKFNKDTVEQFMPESIRDLVFYDKDKEDGYQFYGNAKPEMYLQTWMPSTKRDRKKLNNQGATKGPNGTQMQDASYAAGSMYTGGAFDTAGQYVGNSYMPPQGQQGGPGYYDGGMAQGGPGFDPTTVSYNSGGGMYPGNA